MSDEPNIVWSSTVDNGEWLAQVIWIADYQGNLTVTHVDSGRVILDRLVGLSYGAMFGPDVDDVANWQGWTIEAIDND